MPSNRQVRIVVQDEAERGIANASVFIERAPQPPPRTAVACDGEGAATVTIGAIGLYEFVCGAEGFESASVSAMITDDALSVVMVRLRPSC